MSKQLDDLTKTGFEQARSCLLGTDTELLTTFALVKRNGGIDIIGTPWPSDKEKRAMVLGVCIEALKNDAIAYCFTTEMWFATAKLEGQYAPPPVGPPPRERPDRREGIMVLVSDGKERKFNTWEIIREGGRCAQLVQNAKEALGFESWIADALDRVINLNNADPTGKFREKFKEFLP